MEKEGTSRLKTWSFRRFFLFIWSTLCFYFFITAWYKTSSEGHEMLILYFQPFLPLFGMVWLWGLNIWVFETLHVPYEHLFEDSRTLLKSSHIFQIASVLSTLLLTFGAVFLTALTHNFDQLATWSLMVFLGLCLVVWLMPSRGFYRQTRIAFLKTCGKVLFPVFRVTFSEFLLADILTSLARSIADWVRGVCVLTFSSISETSELEFYCGRRSIYTNLALALPYFIRMIQCLSLHYQDHDRVQFFNAVKYFTAFPVILSSMMKHRASSLQSTQIWNRVWILASVLNTGYSYYWDVEMDWDISWFRHEKDNSVVSWLPIMRSDALYSPQWVYSFALVTNFMIRVAWIYKLSLHLPYTQGIHLLVSVLEVCRRCQWIFIRFENGLRKTNRLSSTNEDKHTKV